LPHRPINAIAVQLFLAPNRKNVLMYVITRLRAKRPSLRFSMPAAPAPLSTKSKSM
jgi:hypothetical protein